MAFKEYPYTDLIFIFYLNQMMNKKIKRANDFFRQGDYISALSLYLEVSESFPSLAPFIQSNISITNARLKSKTGNQERLSVDQYSKYNRDVFVGIASIPAREKNLQKTIDSLIDQVDCIGVFLDKYEKIPSYLFDYGQRIRIVSSSEVDRDLGDAGKFYWVENHKGFYFTCDDDLIYPPDYIERIVTCIQSYKTPVVVGWHGSVILSPFENYYSTKSRRVFGFGAPRPHDTSVHILGTGCLGFHTEHISVKLNDFKTPNMADVYFALLGQQQNIPFVVIKHAKGEIQESEHSQEVSIYKHSSTDIEKSRQNTKKSQNRLVLETKWTLNYADRKLAIAIIGRFKINQKGGIFKSSNLLAEHLESLGHHVRKYCISDDNELNDLLSGEPLPDFVLAYPPDPERPDFGSLVKYIRLLAEKGIVCAVNFSINLQRQRSDWIIDVVKELNVGFSRPRIFLAAFSNSSALIDELEQIRDFIVVIPKTIDPGFGEIKTYSEREGIFLGDLAKLTNNNLVFGDARKWVEQIHLRLPHANIYAIKQYHTDKDFLDYVKILPYQEDGLCELLSQFRICVCLTPGATFEMVPTEAAMLGTPVLHRHMPQSIGEYLSPVGIEVNSPDELGEMCRNIYEREYLWSRLSRASAGFNSTLHVENLCAAIELGIRKCMHRARPI